MKAHEIDNFDELLDDAESQASSNWEMDFVNDMRDRYDQYNDEMFVSEAQLEKLEKIAGW
jgi:hypothetical protein